MNLYTRDDDDDDFGQPGKEYTQWNVLWERSVVGVEDLNIWLGGGEDILTDFFAILFLYELHLILNSWFGIC